MEEDFSFDISEAETGERALEIIENEGADIVLLDNKLPGSFSSATLMVLCTPKQKPDEFRSRFTFTAGVPEGRIK